MPPITSNLRVAVDASPRGLGGVLLSDGVPSRWFADKFSDDDFVGSAPLTHSKVLPTSLLGAT